MLPICLPSPGKSAGDYKAGGESQVGKKFVISGWGKVRAILTSLNASHIDWRLILSWHCLRMLLMHVWYKQECTDGRGLIWGCLQDKQRHGKKFRVRRSVDSGKMKTMSESAKTGQESRILKEAEVSIVSLSIAFSEHYKESIDLNTDTIHCTVYSLIFTHNRDYILKLNDMIFRCLW